MRSCPFEDGDRTFVGQRLTTDETGNVLRLLKGRTYVVEDTVKKSSLSTYRSDIHRFAAEVAVNVCPKARRVIEVPSSDTAVIGLGSAHGLGAAARLRVDRFLRGTESQSGQILDEIPIAQVRVRERRKVTSLVSVPPGVVLQVGDLVYPQRKKGHIVNPRNPERFHLVVHPLKADLPQNAHPQQIQFCNHVCRQVARDLLNELELFDFALLSDLNLFENVSVELQRPGVDKTIAVQSGRALGATHVVTGILATSSSQSAKIQLVLVDMETGEETPLGSARIRISTFGQPR
jgi:hypothetical protein